MIVFMAFVFFFPPFFFCEINDSFLFVYLMCPPHFSFSLAVFIIILFLFCFIGFAASALVIKTEPFFFCFACFGFFLYVFFSGFLYLPIPLILFVLRDKWREYDIHAKSGHWHNYFVITIINFTKRGCPSSASLKGLAHRPLISKVGCAPCELLQERKL